GAGPPGPASPFGPVLVGLRPPPGVRAERVLPRALLPAQGRNADRKLVEDHVLTTTFPCARQTRKPIRSAALPDRRTCGSGPPWHFVRPFHPLSLLGSTKSPAGTRTRGVGSDGRESRS